LINCQTNYDSRPEYEGGGIPANRAFSAKSKSIRLCIVSISTSPPREKAVRVGTRESGSGSTSVFSGPGSSGPLRGDVRSPFFELGESIVSEPDPGPVTTDTIRNGTGVVLDIF